MMPAGPLLVHFCKLCTNYKKKFDFTDINTGNHYKKCRVNIVLINFGIAVYAAVVNSVFVSSA